ncbi:acyl-CoA thioester hydrolase/BAAT C-terminal domain-containing protein [Flavobacterium sp.]|uniref:acyl-CoA thioester hydrolase/BAAT C-terminal domain-containing protein n=1 Tax=Flavobacterium sp. TaxID=239 RepID=UPI002B4B4F37|nr:acyl-CoA thioester hydrolase/BAAT C-terminal domain-containing protein [Flavobacterium sp.]HLP63140.1 acyl-CoA thioester hydrolase/BAAT C-terminal domain-containing protein [Flavobacterium sp.]
MNTSKLVMVLLFISSTIFSYSQQTITAKNVEAILYLGKGKKQPLIVGLGGSEGGNAWTGDYWKKTREEFIEKGYAFLAIGYFGCKNTPAILDKIAIEDIHNAILEATKNKKINKKKIAIIGGSRGGDLALLTASYYKDIKCVIALVSSHAVFPGHTQEFNSSCWTFEGTELPFIPVNEEAVPFLMKGDLRGTFEAMLKDKIAEEKSVIKVENIKASILLLSATKDEVCPSTPMAEKMISRLKTFNFKYQYDHIPIDGSHTEPLKRFDLVFDFLNKNFK